MWPLLGKQFYISDLYSVQIFHWYPKSLVLDCILWSDLLAITTWTNRKLKVLVLLRGRVQQSDWTDLGHLHGNGSTHTVCESACCENSVVIGNWSFNTVAVLCTSGWCGCHSNNFSTFFIRKKQFWNTLHTESLGYTPNSTRRKPLSMQHLSRCQDSSGPHLVASIFESCIKVPALRLHNVYVVNSTQEDSIFSGSDPNKALVYLG